MRRGVRFSSVTSLRYSWSLLLPQYFNRCPQVIGTPTDTDAALADHRARVYHATLMKILESAIAAAGEGGFTFNHGSMDHLLAQLIISILSGDYEE